MEITDQDSDRRREERVSVSLPLSLGDIEDVTKNVSASGIYFEVKEPFNKGDRVDFVIDFGNRGGKLILKCHGEIVRVDNKDAKKGVAVKILKSTMEAV